jgi:hypothetical protein
LVASHEYLNAQDELHGVVSWEKIKRNVKRKTTES